MSEPRTNRGWIILMTFLLSIMSPIASADSSEEVVIEEQSFEPVFGDLSEMVYSNAHPSMMDETEESIYSATR